MYTMKELTHSNIFFFKKSYRICKLVYQILFAQFNLTCRLGKSENLLSSGKWLFVLQGLHFCETNWMRRKTKNVTW